MRSNPATLRNERFIDDFHEPDGENPLDEVTSKADLKVRHLRP